MPWPDEGAGTVAAVACMLCIVSQTPPLINGVLVKFHHVVDFVTEIRSSFYSSLAVRAIMFWRWRLTESSEAAYRNFPNPHYYQSMGLSSRILSDACC